MFQIGDKVVHPMHGAGVIDSIVQEKINGKVQDYYVFRMPINGLVLKIPTANSELVGLRAVIDEDRADCVINSLREAERGLSTGERKMLHNAKQIFISEMVLAKGKPYQEIECRVNETMLGEGA